METKKLCLFALSVFAFVLVASFASADTLADWNLTTDATASYDGTQLTATSLTASLGISDTTSATAGTFDFTGGGATADDWTTTTTIDTTDYYEITITPQTGRNFLVTSLSFAHNTTATMNFAVRSSEDSYTANIGTGSSTATSANSTLSNLNLIVGEGETFGSWETTGGRRKS